MPESSRPKVSSIIVFVGILSVVLYLANLVVYEAVASIFSLTTTAHLLVLGIGLAVLSGSLIGSIVLGMRFYNMLTRVYSVTAAVWIGSFVYLFFASIIYGLAVLFSLSLTAITAETLHTFGASILLCAVLASLYGVVHSKRIKIVEQKVALKNLPQSWQNKKIVFVSDLHLGQIHGRAYAAKIAWEINKISGARPAAVFIGGDLFDGTSAPDLPALIAPLKGLSSIHGTYFITGNHEEFGSDTPKFIEAVKSIGIQVIQDELVEIDGLKVIGVDYETTSTKEGFKDVLSRILADKNKNGISKNIVTVLLKHEPKNIDIARDAGISLQLSGHTHRAQLWPLEYIARRVYGKFAYGLESFGDTQVFTSSGAGTWGPPMRVRTDCEIVVLELINTQ